MSFINIPVAHTGITILRLFCISCSSFHTDNKNWMTDFCSCVFCQWSNCILMCHSLVTKETTKPTSCKWRKVHVVYICHLFQCCQQHFSDKINFRLILTQFCITSFWHDFGMCSEWYLFFDGSVRKGVGIRFAG
jgi:hypothetical protein